MPYNVENLKKVLSRLDEVDEGIIDTEHDVEKVTHRKIEYGFVEDKLKNSKPREIVKLKNGPHRFKLTYECGDCDLFVFLKLFLPKRVIMISAFLKRRDGHENC